MSDFDDDFQVDDILSNSINKKTKGKIKGKRGELEIVKLLNSRFDKILKENPDSGSFSRSVGSGNRWGQNVALSKQAKQVFSGDLTCPDNFKFCIESKIGYNHIDIFSLISNKKDKTFDEFLKQVENDSKRCGRKPLLLWKKDRKNWLVATKDDISFEVQLKYFQWEITSLENLLSYPDEYFFNLIA